MVFVTADSCRTQLARLTRLLVAAFPGSTIYQHTDLFRVPRDALKSKVDAVFLEAKPENTGGLDLMQKLRRQKPELPIFIISETDSLCETAIAAGASGYFVLSDSEQCLLDAMRLAFGKETAS